VTLDELAALHGSGFAARQRRVVPAGPLVRAAGPGPAHRARRAPSRVRQADRHRGHSIAARSASGWHRRSSDASLLAAALRECEEEIGLPPAAVEPLARSDDTETFATNFVITPWVGVVREPVAWRPDGDEIERVIEVPFARAQRAGRGYGSSSGA